MARPDPASGGPRRSAPPVFQIGFSCAGEGWLAALVRQAGAEACLFEQGRLAEDLYFSRALGRPPLRPWPAARFFGDIERVHRTDLPMLEGFRAFRALDRAFPGAAFLLNTRPLDEWIAARWAYQEGLYRGFHALHRGVRQSALPEIWAEERAAHHAAVERHFAGRPELIRWDMAEDEPAALAQALAPWIALPPDAPPPPRSRRRGRPVPPADPPLPDADAAAGEIAAVVRHALGTRRATGPEDTAPPPSRLWARWNGSGRADGPDGARLPLLRARIGRREMVLAPPGVEPLDRVQSLLHEALALGATRPFVSDMEDAREAAPGVPGSPPEPWIAFNRRAGAANLVLWPLPGYHALGDWTYAHPRPIDPVAFEDKRDAVGWRGMLSGVPNPPVTVPGRDGPVPLLFALGVQQVLASGRAGAQDEELRAALTGLPRYRAVARHADDPDFDLKLTLHDSVRTLERDPAFQGLCGPRERPDFVFSFRYILCIGGNDAGSNFILAANSNSVVLREETGWELFYDPLFRPWEHYIPLAPAAADLRDKLAWARANPARCREMVRAAQGACRILAAPRVRQAMLGGILDGLGLRGG